jgi:hypothetical protein
MPILVSKTLTNANITGSNNFLSVITTTNALQLSGATGTALTTTFVPTPNSFVGAGETVTAIGLEVGSIGALGLAGVTLTIQLSAPVSVGEYTYDATLLTTGGRGWNFFSLPTPVVLTAGTSYRIQVKSNTASRINLLRSNVADWNRIFVTNTDATFATGDTLYLGGRLLDSGSITPTSMVVNASISLVNLFINNGASLNWASNNLTMTLSGGTGVTGSLFVFPGSSFTIGTSSSPVQGKIEFINGSTLGLNAFSVFGPCTFNIYGSDISSNYVIDLASTANSGQANAVLVSAPDWVAGNEIAYTSSRTAVASEVETISSVSSTTVTNLSSFNFTHDVTTRGTYSPVPDVAKACLMDRGFVVRNASLTQTGSWFGSIYGAVICNWNNVYFRDQGQSLAAAGVVPAKNGWVVDITSGGSFTINNCSFYPANTTNLYAIGSENNTTRLGADYTITNCLMVSRGAGSPAFLIRNGAIGSNTTVSGCVVINTATNSGYVFFTRTSNSANINISNCFAYGFPTFISRNDATVTGVGTLAVDGCYYIGVNFYLVNNVYSSGTFILGSTAISNCIAINRIAGSGTAAVIFQGITSVLHTISSCKFIGYNRYYYTIGSLEAGTIFNDCVFEDDTVTSQTSILVGTVGRPNVAFENCYFSTTFANQSFIGINWTNLPLYSDGKFYFRDCSFNGDGSQFVATTSLKYFAGFFATLKNCTFRTGGTTLDRNYVKMGTATVSTDTFSGTGKSIALTPYSINEATYPFRHQFLLPTTATSFTVNFKTKSYGLDGTVVAYIENAFGVVAQSTLTVSSAWDSQSITVTGLTAYTEILNLTIELTGTSGYLVVDDIEVTNASGIISDGGKYAFLNLTSGGGPSETSHLFC